MPDYAALRITRANPDRWAADGDRYWLRFLQEQEDDKITYNEVARVVDALYDIDPCVEQAVGEPAEVTPVTPEKLYESVAEIFGYDMISCRTALSGEYTSQIKVIRSHPLPTEPYQLELSAGTVQMTQKVREPITLDLDVSGTNSINLDWPILSESDFSAEWLGTVIGELGVIYPPAVGRTGNTVHWNLIATGTLRLTFGTEYDLVTINVPGVPDAEGSESGTSQDIKLLAFYHFLIFSGDLTAPPQDDALSTGALRQLCGYMILTPGGVTVDQGGGTDIEDDEEPEPDPDEPQYGCQDEDTRYGLSSTYEQICCHPPDFHPESCLLRTERHRGGQELSDEDREAILKQYPNAEFIPVGPDGAEGCGTITYTLDIVQRSCCVEVGPLIWDEETTPETIGGNSTAIIALQVGSGQIPLRWKIRGQGFFFDPQFRTREHVSYSYGVHIWTHNACGTAYIEVTDGCTTITRPIRSTDGSWHALPQTSWPSPSGITHYDSLVDPGVFEVVVGEYKYRQQFSRIPASTDYRVDEWSYDTICALPPPTPMSQLIAAQQAQIDPDVPQYISNDIFLEACQRGDSAPYSSFSDVEQFPWAQCAQGILCLEYQRARPGIVYQCHFQAAGLKPLNIISIWKWGC